MALIEVAPRDPKAVQARQRAESWLLDHLGSVRRASGDALYNNWAHAYGIEALVLMLKEHPADAPRNARIRKLIAQQIDMLARYEFIDGGWGYYDFGAHTRQPSGSTISFVTATVLVALAHARDAGIAVPERIVKRATDSILRQRKPDFSYDYGEYLKYFPLMPVNRPGGSLGRSQACNLAMLLWGDRLVTNAILRTWLDRLFAAISGSIWAASVPFRTNRGSRWPATSITTATTTPRW